MANVEAAILYFRSASDLANKPEARQVNTLLYCLGERAEYIFASFNLSKADAKKFYVVIERFNQFFIVKKNVIFEKVQFNKRKQAPSETANDFFPALFKLSETCEYGELRDQLMRDRLVVEIADAKLSEKLQMDKDLTLERAIITIKQVEQVRGQQDVLRNSEGQGLSDTTDLPAIRYKLRDIRSTESRKKPAPKPKG